MNTPDCLEVKDLTFAYEKDRIVFESLNFSLERGKVLSLIGPDGVGKSTLLLCIARQMMPKKGEIFIDGSDIKTFSGKELSKKIAVLFTERERGSSETVFETAAKGRYPYTGWFGNLTAPDEEKVEESLRETDCLELKERLFDNLSDGQKQRVLIARAIAQESGLLILDEPTSYLDLKYQIETMELLRKLAHERKMSIILSIHELALAKEYSDKILMLKDKGIFAYDSPEKVMNAETIGKLFDIKPSVCDRLL